MKYKDLTWGQTEAVINKIGGEATARALLSGKVTLSEIIIVDGIPFVWIDERMATPMGVRPHWVSCHGNRVRVFPTVDGRWAVSVYPYLNQESLYKRVPLGPEGAVDHVSRDDEGLIWDYAVRWAKGELLF